MAPARRSGDSSIPGFPSARKLHSDDTPIGGCCNPVSTKDLCGTPDKPRLSPEKKNNEPDKPQPLPKKQSTQEEQHPRSIKQTSATPPPRPVTEEDVKAPCFSEDLGNLSKVTPGMMSLLNLYLIQDPEQTNSPLGSFDNPLGKG